MTEEKKETERYVEMAGTGAVEEDGESIAATADTIDAGGGTGAAPPPHSPNNCGWQRGA